MGYAKVKYDPRDYSCSDAHPEIAQLQQIPELARWRLYYIHTMLTLNLMEWAKEMPYLTSAFRGPQLNEAVGSKSRQHMRGEAVDFLWKNDHTRVFKAFNFIKEDMFHSTGYCILYIDLLEARFKQIHWALPLGFDMEPRRNPRKFWFNYDGSLHATPPVDIYQWEGV